MAALHAGLRARTPAILQLLYDEDIVEEKAIFEWAAKPSKKYAPKEVAAEIRKQAQPFLAWLREADEEESSGDENGSGGDIEIEYSDRATRTSAPAPAPAREDEDPDLDIDAI